MYARSVTVRGDAGKVDELVAHIRDEAMPAMQAMSGCVGVSMLCDRDAGRCIVTSAWADETALHASEEAMRESRERGAQIMGGEYEMTNWEIALLHRMHEGHEGARARVLWGESDPARAEDNLAVMRMAMLPRMEELPGFCSVSLLVDRATGRSAMTTCYDTQADMDRARDAAMAMREEFTREMGVTLTDVADFDLVLHHLRVPETV